MAQPFYGTKPKLVQAIQWLGNNANAIREFGGDSVSVLNAELIEVRTEKGPLRVRVGEYLLQTEDGFQVCPEPLFALVFEPVQDDDEIDLADTGIVGGGVAVPPPGSELIDVPPAPPAAELPAVFEPVPAAASVPVVPPAIEPEAPPAPHAAPAAEAPIIPAEAMAPAPEPTPAPTDPPFTSTPQ